MADDKRLVPSFQLLVDGRAADAELAGSVIGIRCSDDLDRAARFQIHLSDLARKWTRGDRFKPGTAIEIKLGYQGQLRTVCKAEVQSLEVILAPDGPTRVVIAGLDQGHGFARGTVTRTYKDVKDSDLAREIAQRNDLTADVDDSKVVHEFVFQNNLSDHDFLLQRAALAGFRFLVDGKKLVFKKPRLSEPPAAKLTWRENIGRFMVEVNTYDQVAKLSAAGWDPKQRTELTSAARKGDEYAKQGGQLTGAQLVKERFGDVEATLTMASGQQNLLEAAAKSEFNKRSGAFVSAEGRVTGDPAIRAGTVIELAKAAKRIDGEYYVVSAEHVFFADTGYATGFRARRYTIHKQPDPAAAKASRAAAPAAATAAVDVRISDAGSKAPLQGVQVSLNGPKGPLAASTDSRGVAHFASVGAGQCQISAALENFTAPAPTTLTVAANRSNAAAIALQPNAVTAAVAPSPLVLVLKKHNCAPARKAVTLKTTGAFAGANSGGRLTRSKATLKLFSAAVGGSEITFNGTDNRFSAAQLAAGVQLFAEGVAVSSSQEDTDLELELFVGSNAFGKPGIAKSTVIGLSLELFQSRTDPGKAPAAVDANGKTDEGRFVHQQDPGFHHGRAWVVVREVTPAGFKQDLELRVLPSRGASGALQLFTAETHAAGEPAVALPRAVSAAELLGAPQVAGKKGLAFFAEGNTVSAALRDVVLQLGIRGDEPDGDRAAFTVVRLSNLVLTAPSTPPRTVRGGNGPVPPSLLTLGAGGAPTAREYEEGFAGNAPVVLIENSVLAASPLTLGVNVAPAGVPVRFEAHRATAAADKDAAAIVNSLAPKPSGLPKLVQTSAVPPLRATVLADSVGSFHLRAFVDCNGSATFGDKEPYMVANLILVRVQGVSNSSLARNTNWGFGASGTRPAPGSAFSASRATGLAVSTGGFATPAQAAVHNDAVVNLIGGGPTGAAGLDQVFLGWVNNEHDASTGTRPNASGEDVVSSYLDSTVVPPATHARLSVWVNGGGFFSPGGVPLPPLVGGPVLDTTNFGNEGTGGNRCVGTEGAVGPPRPVVQTAAVRTPGGVGKSARVEMWDSPGDDCPPALATLAGVLQAYRFNLDFSTDLVAWTNDTRSAAPTPRPILAGGANPDPACCLYASVQRNTWTIRFAIAFPAAAAPVARGTLALARDASPTRLAQGVAALEVRSPVSLNLLGIQERM